MEPTQTPTPNPVPTTNPSMKKTPVAAIVIIAVLVIAAVILYVYHGKKDAAVTAAPGVTTADTAAQAVPAVAAPAASTSVSASDPDFSVLVSTTLAFKAMVTNKDAAGLVATEAKFASDSAEMSSELSDPQTGPMIYDLFAGILSGVDQASLDSGLTCTFYEKAPGKTYDRAAVCHIETTVTPSADVSALLASGSADLKLTFSKLGGVWYMQPPTTDDLTPNAQGN